jgi:hypothetical protein
MLRCKYMECRNHTKLSGFLKKRSNNIPEDDQTFHIENPCKYNEISTKITERTTF